jgi:hypothetical protein
VFSTSGIRKKGVTVAQKTIAITIDESEQFAAQHEGDPTDRVIFTCYRLIRSFEQTNIDEQKIGAISRETLARTLREIAGRAFTVGWNTKDLTSIQRAQILDIILSVADLAARVT